MKVALLHYSAPPVVGGVETVLGIHARLMASAGHQVCILAGRGERADPQIPLTRMPLLDSRHPEVLKAKAALDAGVLPDDFPDLVAAISELLHAALEGVDVLVAHNVCSLHKNLALTAAIYELNTRAGAPRLVLWHHDLAWTTPRYRSELHDGYPWDLLRQDWSEAAQVVVSELRQQELAQLTGAALERVRVVPNGIDIPAFLKLGQSTIDLTRQLDLLTANPLLLLPVRITRRKNIELALRTLAELRQEFHRAALVVTGPLGPHNPANRAYFEQLLALRFELGLTGCAHFLAELYEDYLPDEVIADLYRLADTLFFPSREEGFGIPILEAGLARLPIFCADIPPLRKLGGEWAVYFSPDADPEELAQMMARRLTADPAFRLRRQVQEAYTWEKIYTEQIEPILGAKGDVS
jgi:glycosyltransferase involved in cell wall biosynthesis